MTTSPQPVRHPLLGCAAEVHAALDAVADLGATYLTADDKRALLLELTAAGARVEELRLRVLAAGQALGDVAEADGSRDAAAWLAHHAHLDPGRARHLARLATSLDSRHRTVAAALRSGRLDVTQADVIVHALDALPEEVDAEVRGRAEARLVEEARHFDPRRLRVLGRRILQVVAPEVADDHERRLLEAEESHAARSTFLRTRRRGDGTTDLHVRVADTVADRLLTYLHAFTSPRRPAGAQESPTDRRPYDQRLGHAFGALLESVDPDHLPLHGGGATTVIVTIDLETLRGDLAAGGVALMGDTPISAAEARRLACTAAIVPAVLGGASRVLDLGRTRRLFTDGQRKALTLVNATCIADGCDIPAAWCEAHHGGDPWSRGGRTDLDDGDLLCSHHHHLAHDPRYDTTRHPDGSLRFHRRV